MEKKIKKQTIKEMIEEIADKNKSQDQSVTINKSESNTEKTMSQLLKDLKKCNAT